MRIFDGLTMQLLIELGPTRLLPIPSPPGERGVPHNRQDPGSAVARLGPAESVEVLERPEIRILHDILSVVLVAREIARQRVRGVQVRQHDGFESAKLAWVHRGKTPATASLFPRE